MKVSLWMVDAAEEIEPMIDSREVVPTPSAARQALYSRFRNRITHNPALDRALVSFQANKRVPFYSWFKYREGFSEPLVTYLLRRLHPEAGMLLDPFAGSGSALFAASTLGWTAKGVELLPVGVYITQARQVASRVNPERFSVAVRQTLQEDFAAHYDESRAFRHIAITQGAFPPDQERELVGYLAYCQEHVPDADIRTLLLFAAFCVLEDISYTRKDGQYLRWDDRAGRRRGKKPFSKGYIPPFREALQAKLRQMVADIESASPQQTLFDEVAPQQERGPDPDLLQGSCLEILPTLDADSINFVLTSPPYANRYDYTRTYALELVFLGCGDEKVKELRQSMLSCTVENRDKRAQLRHYYAQLGREEDCSRIEQVFDQQAALHEVLAILEAYRERGQLNNDNIARLVRNYFYEMCFVAHEMFRSLRPGGIVAMVNDNVRYAGEEVPVDLILSSMAEAFGLKTRHIWTLGRGKGNSSQQMGNHGRSELRKCVYVWQK